MPSTAAPPKLEPVDLLGVELLATGTHDASTGRVKITRRTIDNIVAAYDSLKGVLHVPVKIGHSDSADNGLVDGEPAAGWVENLRVKMVGKTSKLIADLRRVPSKLASVMQAGAYRSRSVEIQRNYRVDGKGTFPAVLTGLAVLGAELPAVKGLDDIFDLYRECFGEDCDDGYRLAFSATDADWLGDAKEVTSRMADSLSLFDDLAAKLEETCRGQRGVRDMRAILRTAKAKVREIMRRTQASEGEADDLAAVPTHSPPFVENEGPWDADAAVAELQRWASSDGSGDPLTIDFDKYRQGFAVVEGDPKNLGSYKFPHHRIVDGALKTSAAGVRAAFTAASGGRSGQRNQDALTHLEPHREAAMADIQAGESLGKTIGDAIRERAGPDGSIEDEMAKVGSAAGISGSTVGEIVSGDINCPPLKRLEGIAKALGLSMDTLRARATADGCKYADDTSENKDGAEMKTSDIAVRLGLSEDATPCDVLKKLDEITSNDGEAEKDALAERVKASEDEVAQLRAERLAEKNEALIDEAIAAFRVTPAEKKGLLEIFGTMPVEKVAAHLKARSKVLMPGAVGSSKNEDGSQDLSEFDPTPDEILAHEMTIGHDLTDGDKQFLREFKARKAGITIAAKAAS